MGVQGVYKHITCANFVFLGAFSCGSRGSSTATAVRFGCTFLVAMAAFSWGNRVAVPPSNAVITFFFLFLWLLAC